MNPENIEQVCPVCQTLFDTKTVVYCDYCGAKLLNVTSYETQYKEKDMKVIIELEVEKWNYK